MSRANTTPPRDNGFFARFTRGTEKQSQAKIVRTSAARTRAAAAPPHSHVDRTESRPRHRAREHKPLQAAHAPHPPPPRAAHAVAATEAPSSPLMRRTGGMTIDSDGAARATDKRTHSDTTFLQWGAHHVKGVKDPVTSSVNANQIPYISVKPSLLNKTNGVKPGDLVRVTYNGRQAYAIVADKGGHGDEGSVRLAQMLGIPHDARTGGVDGGVAYEIMRGSGASRGIYQGTDKTFTEADIQRIGNEVFNPRAESGAPANAPPPDP